MKVALFEPDPLQAQILVEYVGEKLQRVASAPELFELFEASTVKLLIMEYQLGEYNCLDILHELRSYPDLAELPVIVLTNTFINSSVLNSKSFKRLNITKHLYKPKTTLKEIKKLIDQIESENYAA